MESGSGFFSLEEFQLDPKFNIDPKLLFVGPRIGEGAHAKVYEGKYVSYSEICISVWLLISESLHVFLCAHFTSPSYRYKKQNVAIKIIHKGETPEEIRKRDERFAREVAMLSRVQHKNLVKVTIIYHHFHLCCSASQFHK